TFHGWPPLHTQCATLSAPNVGCSPNVHSGTTWLTRHGPTLTPCSFASFKKAPSPSWISRVAPVSAPSGSSLRRAERTSCSHSSRSSSFGPGGGATGVSTTTTDLTGPGSWASGGTGTLADGDSGVSSTFS